MTVEGVGAHFVSQLCKPTLEEVECGGRYQVAQSNNRLNELRDGHGGPAASELNRAERDVGVDHRKPVAPACAGHQHAFGDALRRIKVAFVQSNGSERCSGHDDGQVIVQFHGHGVRALQRGQRAGSLAPKQ